MAIITELIENIRKAVYGKDVRESIAAGIEKINEEVMDTTSKESDLEKTFKQLLINAGNSNAEIVAARGEAETLSDRLDEMNAIRYELAYNIDDFPLIEADTNQKDRFARAIEAIPAGAILVVNDGTYDFGGNYLEINKSVNVIGGTFGNTIIKDGGIKFLASNITVENISIEAPNLGNGFEGHSCAISNIFIRKCKTKCKDHGFLFESYNGAVQNVLIENCIAVNGKHGFVSKALGVKIINCSANNCASYGFALVSDNMAGNGKNGQAWNNVIDNCYAYNCQYGLKMYCRDKYNSTCVVSLKNNIISNFIANACKCSAAIGEKEVPEGYTSILPVKTTIVDNVISYGTTGLDGEETSYSVYIDNATNCKITNLILDKDYIISDLVDEKTKISMSEELVTEAVLSNEVALIDGLVNKVVKKNNKVVLNVNVRYKTVDSNGLTAETLLFTLPEGYRPPFEINKTLAIGRAGSINSTIGCLRIKANGQCYGICYDGVTAFYTLLAQEIEFSI